MVKCAEPGCGNCAVDGARLCIYHRDLKNGVKDSWIKVALSVSGVLVAAAVVLFVVSDSDDRANA